MTISREASDAIDLIDQLPVFQQEAIGNAVDDLMLALRAAGFKTAGDDRAANLEGAIVQYLFACDPALHERLEMIREW